MGRRSGRVRTWPGWVCSHRSTAARTSRCPSITPVACSSIRGLARVVLRTRDQCRSSSLRFARQGEVAGGRVSVRRAVFASSLAAVCFQVAVAPATMAYTASCGWTRLRFVPRVRVRRVLSPSCQAWRTTQRRRPTWPSLTPSGGPTTVTPCLSASFMISSWSASVRSSSGWPSRTIISSEPPGVMMLITRTG